jgi:general stress protein YciG
MASNRGSQGGTSGGGEGRRDQRGFASMDDNKQREIARKGGEASAAKQGRDAQGQFTGTRGGSSSSSSSGGSRSSSGSGSRDGNGGSNR